MKFALKIDMDNAAFEGLEENLRSGAEVARILKKLAAAIEDENLSDFDGGSVLDLNGNKVGNWTVDGE